MLTLAALEKLLMENQDALDRLVGRLAAVEERQDGVANRLADTVQTIVCTDCRTIHFIPWAEL